MCGIFASITEKKIDGDNVLSSLKRRGPDGQGQYQKEIVVHGQNRLLNLLHTRLSIVDPQPQSNQPFHSEDGRYVMVFNGEIYNHLELRSELEGLGHSFKTKSDTEALLRSYIQWGSESLNRLRGIFSLCIWDNKKETLFLARDHLGVKPLYLLHHGSEFAVSSTIESLFASGLVSERKINEQALDHYLAFGSFDGKNTLIDQIKMFPPGHFALLSNDHLKVQKFWQMTIPDRPLDISYTEATDKVANLMLEATELQMRADVDVGAFLSGGIDSGLLVALMSRYTDKPLHTYSIGFEDNKKLLEWDLAKLSANKYQTKHREIKITEDIFRDSLDEFIESVDHPTVDGLNSFFVARETGKELKVAISGLGGDEAFAGYFFYPRIYQSSLAPWPFKKMASILPQNIRKRGKFSFLKYSTEHLEQILHEHRIIQPAPNKNRIFDPIPLNDKLLLSGTTYHELSYYTPNTLLRDVDAVSMYSSLEVRVPFLDHKLIEFTLSLPDQFKTSSKYNKPLLIDAFPDLLPEQVIHAPKRGFEMPVGRWLHKRYSGELSTLSSSLSQIGVPSEITERSIHLFKNNPDNYRPVWKLIVLKHWLERYLF